MWITEGEVVSLEQDRVGVRKVRSSFAQRSAAVRPAIAYPDIHRITVIKEGQGFV